MNTFYNKNNYSHALPPLPPTSFMDPFSEGGEGLLQSTLKSCNFCPNIGVHLKETIRKAVEELLKDDPEKKKLNLRYKHIGNKGAQTLGAALKVNQTLQKLHLHGNTISNTGVQAIGTALQINHTLQSLNLHYNEIGNGGAQALGAFLKINHTLQKLDLSSNQIGDVGVQALGSALEINHTLQSLNLSDNKISDPGAQALCASLKVNQTLQSLNLNLNQIGNVGAQALGTALQVNHTLQELDLWTNKIGRAERVTIEWIDTLQQANEQMTAAFQQQIKQVQNFLQSHENDEGMLLQNLPQLTELLQKWQTDSKDIIYSLEKILQQSGRTDLNDGYRKKLVGIITTLSQRLHDLWREPFKRKLNALSNEYVMGKELSSERNVDLGYALYETWLTFFGSHCPNWLEDHLETLLPFSALLDIAEGGKKKDITDLTDARLLFERVLSFKNESKDSLFSLTTQSINS